MLRWPLGGLIASFMADALDVVLMGAIGDGEFANYPGTDKLLDTYYLTFAMVLSLRWQNAMAKRTSVALYAYRVVGVVLFGLTGFRPLLLVFPNAFEYFVMFYLFMQFKVPTYRLATAGQLTIVLLAIFAIKLPQEFILHYLEFGPWQWFHTTVLGIA